MEKDASKYSVFNMVEIRKSKMVGCYYCLEIYKSSEIQESVDEGETAICPKCGIDSVLPETSPFLINDETLKNLNKIWF